MRKTFISVFLAAAVLRTLLAFPVQAAENEPLATVCDDGSTVIYYEDGGYLTITPAKAVSEEAGNRSQTTDIKSAYYTNPSGVEEWRYTLHATFTYQYGVSASCTNAYYSQQINAGNWTFSNGAATASGATAHGTGTYTEKLWFITLRTMNIDISLTCDIYGIVL